MSKYINLLKTYKILVFPDVFKKNVSNITLSIYLCWKFFPALF